VAAACGDEKPSADRAMTDEGDRGDDIGDTPHRDDGHAGGPAAVAVASPESEVKDALIGFALIVGLVMLIAAPLVGLLVHAWNGLTDVPLRYESGDRPRGPEVDEFYDDCARWAEPQVCETGLPRGGSDDWVMNAATEISTTYRPEGRPRIDSLARRLELHSVDVPCRARVEWSIVADGDELATGTVEWIDELRDVDIPSRRAPETLTITARRTDEADCRSLLRWVDPGFNGPGLGKFRLN
jgi:hypothetical protein